MPKLIIYAPRPADKALKVLAALLKLENVQFMTDPSECRIIAEDQHPLTDEVVKTTIQGWASCVKYMAENTVLWDAPNTLEEEDWIQMAATALFNGKQTALVESCVWCRSSMRAQSTRKEPW